jgi:hypothetical protein
MIDVACMFDNPVWVFAAQKPKRVTMRPTGFCAAKARGAYLFDVEAVFRFLQNRPIHKPTKSGSSPDGRDSLPHGYVCGQRACAGAM